MSTNRPISETKSIAWLDTMRAYAFQTNKSKYYYEKLSKIIYCLGGPNYFYEELQVPNYIKKMHKSINIAIDVLLFSYCGMIFGAFFTQHNLNRKQQNDTLIYGFTFGVLYSLVPIVKTQVKNIRVVFFNVCIKMKRVYNDADVENEMVKKAKLYSYLYGFSLLSMLVFNGINAGVKAFLEGGTFTTAVITAWPDIHDTSTAAGIGRLINYLLWWLFVIRLTSVAYSPLILMTIAISHQYKNLNSYFYSLAGIFEREDLSQIEKEKMYNDAMKRGIAEHSNLLECLKLTQKICNIPFGGRITFNVVSLTIFSLTIAKSEHTVANVMTSLVVVMTVLIGTGCFWWNAGDITIEASQLPVAMFYSGWHNCYGVASGRIKSSLLITMWKSQKPVTLTCFGFISLSYSSYVTIVRTPYSVVSVLYTK